MTVFCPELGHFLSILVTGVPIEVCHMIPGTKYYVLLRRRTLNYRMNLGIQGAQNVHYARPMRKGLVSVAHWSHVIGGHFKCHDFNIWAW